jgi:hypothetical protein
MLRLDLDGQWWFEALLTPERAEVLKRSIEGERLITPPADSRILPGVTRARLLELEQGADALLGAQERGRVFCVS